MCLFTWVCRGCLRFAGEQHYLQLVVLPFWVSLRAWVVSVLGPASSRSVDPGYSSNGIPKQTPADGSVSSMAGPKGVQHGQVSGTLKIHSFI